jgi:hypothetical protein
VNGGTFGPSAVMQAGTVEPTALVDPSQGDLFAEWDNKSMR